MLPYANLLDAAAAEDDSIPDGEEFSEASLGLFGTTFLGVIHERREGRSELQFIAGMRGPNLCSRTTGKYSSSVRVILRCTGVTDDRSPSPSSCVAPAPSSAAARPR